MFDIYHNFLVKAEPQQVFEAFCTPAGLNAWWTLESGGSPVVGNQYRFYFGPSYDWRAEVIQVVPGFELTWRMQRAMDDWLLTEVGFLLKRSDQGTSVSFFHKGWKDANEHFGITTFCWGQLLMGLKNYVERGVIVPFDKRN